MNLLGMSEASRRLRVHPLTVRRWEASGILTAIRDSANRRLFREEDVAALVEQRAECNKTEVAGV